MYSYRQNNDEACVKENKDSVHHNCRVCLGTGRDLSIAYIDACPICTKLAEDHYQRLEQQQRAIKVSTAGILFFLFIIASYFIGMWAGTKIAQPKIIAPKPQNRNTKKKLQNRMGLPTARRNQLPIVLGDYHKIYDHQ